MKEFLLVINYILFYLINIIEAKKYKVFFSFIFLGLSYIFFFLVDLSKLPDYQQYYNVIGLRENEISLKSFFTEPYYFDLVNLLHTYFSKDFSIFCFYFLNTTITSIFFVYISFNKKLSGWKNIFLYSMYYYFFSFILLRNTPSYILVAVLFYFLNKKYYPKFSILAFLCHLSSLPILVFSIFKNKNADFKLFILIIGYVFMFKILTQIEIFGIYEKLMIYQDDKEFGQGVFHKVYFFCFLLFNIFLFLKYKNVIFNYTYILFLTTYVILHSMGPVMGFRFSIYLILYIFLNYNFSIGIKNKFYLNFLSFFFLTLVIINYLQLFK